MDKRIKFIIAVLIQLAILSAIIVYKSAIYFGGEAVYLRIEPLDPRDPLRGDFVTFRYSNISRLSGHHFRNNENLNAGDVVYVVLRKYGKNNWEVTRAQLNKPLKLNDGELFLKGKISNIGNPNSFRYQDMNSGSAANLLRNQTLEISYGIEQYFIPEGTGADFNFRSGKAYAEVSVDEDGNAVLKQVYIDGRPWP